MKRFLVLTVCLWPGLLLAQQSYSNADLVHFQVPGAYTNADLRLLEPLVVQKEPAARLPLVMPPHVDSVPFQVHYDGLVRTRAYLSAELDLELERVAFSESAFAGDPQSFAPRAGYRARVRSLIQELSKRITLLDHEIDMLLDDARQAGATVGIR